MNDQKLRKLLNEIRYLITLSEIDRLCGFPRTTISSRLNSYTEFNQNQIDLISAQLKNLQEKLAVLNE